jgi:hypothetical protein
MVLMAHTGHDAAVVNLIYKPVQWVNGDASSSHDDAHHIGFLEYFGLI